MFLDDARNWFNAKIAFVKTELRRGAAEWEATHSAWLPPQMASAATEGGHDEAITEEPAPPCLHPKELIHAIGGCGDRCAQCGEVLNPHRGPVGVSRGAYLRGDWDQRKARENSSSFHAARAKLLGR